LTTDYYFLTVGPKKSCRVKARTNIQPEAKGRKPLPVMNRQVHNKQKDKQKNCQSLTQVSGAKRTYTSWDLPRNRGIKMAELALHSETTKQQEGW